MGSFCIFGAMEHSGTFRKIFGTSREPRAFRIPFVKLVRFANRDFGCTRLHHVARVAPVCMRVRLSKNSRLRLRGSTRVGDPRALVREAASGKTREKQCASTTPQSCAIVTT